MQSVEDIAAEIVAREGGYVNDPSDPGGPTKYGVTLETMRSLGIDLDGDGVVTEADVKRLSRSRAIAIFVEHYYHRPHLDTLPEALQPSVFDMYVNSGTNAVKILQRLVTTMGFACADDGVIGPKTIAAVQAAARTQPAYIADAYAIARRNYYFRLADACPDSRKYARTRSRAKGGWITRAEQFMAPQYRLTDAQFDDRTKGWA